MTLFVAEPAGHRAPRPNLVVDASVIAASLFGERERDAAEAQMRGRTLCAPALIDYELADVALARCRAKSLSPDDAIRALEIYATLQIERWNAEPLPVMRLAQAFGLAAYLWLAGSIRAPIATFDARLAAAAKTFLKQLPPSR
jgi:predicted nucleic acid-binding protein